MPAPRNIHSICRVTLSGLTALVLAACAETPASRGVAGAVAVPTGWREVGLGAAVAPLDAAALSKWWERFGDPALNELANAEENLAVVNRSVATRLDTLQITRWREQPGRGSARPAIDWPCCWEGHRAAWRASWPRCGLSRRLRLA